MNAAHLHIILNHIPVIGIPMGAALLLYGVIRKSEEVKRVSLLVFIIVGLITVPTFLAGKAAEDIVEHLPGVSENLIETHEEAATVGLVATSALALLAAGGLARSLFAGSLGTLFTILLLAVSFGVSGWLGRVANLGGKIRHTELREGAVLDDDEAEGHDERPDARDNESDGERAEARDSDGAGDEGGKRRRGRGRGRGRGR